MEGSSIVSKARTAFHSAAAKAERVFTDITKSDSSTDRGNVYIDSIGEVSDNKSPKTPNSDSPNTSCESKSHHEVEYCTRKQVPLKTKQDWHERLKNIRIRKKGVEDFDKAGNPTMSFAIFDENLYLMSMTNVSESKGSETGSLPECLSNSSIIPPASVMKLLAIAVEAGKKFNSVKDLLASSRGSSPVRERAISAVKSLVLREKEENFSTEFGGDEKLLSLINLLLDAEGQFPGRKIGTDSDIPTNMTSLPKDIHGAPPESFVVRLSEVIGTFKTLRKMAFFWYKVVSELRRLWSEGQYVPGIPPDNIPDLNSCLIYQKLQVINCCISRKRRRDIATESLESVIRQASSNVEESAVSEGTVPVTPVLYARISTGELVLRLGTDKQSDNLTMLENGEPVYTPDMQEGPLLTEDLIKETEELVLRTGSLGAGCSQLLSDMQAFKAANPGCILEDFVRWHSPPDWTEMEPSGDAEVTSNDGDLLSTKGQLSSRMQKEGNLWRELWETAKPVPAVKQAPLFDEDLAVEGILNDLEDIPPSELFEQLFVSLLGCGFVIAEEKLSTNNNLSKLFCECKDYIITTCQGSVWTEKIDDICQVYETVEMMILKPEEAVKMIKQPEETTTTAGEPRRRFKRLSVIFGSKDRHSGKPALKDQKNGEDNATRQSFSSIFSKKPPRPDAPSSAEKPVCSVENDWTVV
ncbi:rab3 GTPase-activating protein catalytic subunit isoform X2 [Camellia sinensis]|uniref:rab3 GTPase-activating protein catalytic subunit isoform X2 n=1 Tax=Camellia sinensis TaxID=4442 RepID=UPI001036E212|nr:rab3 GTPase-activating protein catalytic subunit isoform X2 [Camellia sinensis]